jgi:predicted ATPase/class 3 adenylate cyclase
MTQELPEGMVTFLFTDVEGSTRMFEQAPDLMFEALRLHDKTIDEAVTAHGGVLVRPRGEGDSRFIVFTTAHDAIAGASAMQLRLAAVEWPTPIPLQVRASLHTGIADLRSGDYYGSAVNRAARLRGIAHGGQTLMSRATWELVQDELPDGVTIIDLGKHELKDLTRPEWVYQVTPDGLPVNFPPLASLNFVPNNLPEQLTEFVGRQQELSDACRLIGETRLLTILAPGGTGKTRLGIQTAAEVSNDFPDGVFFIGFADISSNDDIIQTITESLGVALSGDEDVLSQLLTYLAPRQQLLMLDNLEHLEGAAVIIAEILKSAPNVKLLATSRSKLNLTGETILSLSGLDITWAHPEEAMQASGAQLFIEAAKRSNPSFELETDKLDPLGEILHLVGGMPLGILLAAAWVDMLSIEEIATEIRKSFDFLETEMQDLPVRQRSIRAVFDYSWDLLNPQERETFTALSVFRGGFNREAAEAVAGASLRSLASLVNKSLVTANPDTKRYEVHELLRQYAAAELELDGDRHRQIRDSHADFFAEVMGEAPYLLSHGRQVELLAIMETDIENIRSAWRHQITISNAREALKFVHGLFMLYEFRGWYSASIALFNEALDGLPENINDDDITVLRALASAVKGWSLALLSQPDAAVLAAAKSTELLAQSSNLLNYWIGVQCLAMALVYQGSIEEMAAQLDKAIARLDSLDDRFWVAALNNWRTFAAFVGADFDGATRYVNVAIKHLGSVDDYYVTVWNLWLRAMIATQENRPDDAIDLYTEQVARCREVSYVRGTMVSLEGLGEANVAAGRLEAAEIAFIEGIAAAEGMGMVRDMLGMMTKVAGVRAQRGQLIEAVELLATVLTEPTSIHQPFTDTTPINETASAALSGLEDELDPETFSIAYARGAEQSYDEVAKQLLANPANADRK